MKEDYRKFTNTTENFWDPLMESIGLVELYLSFEELDLGFDLNS